MVRSLLHISHSLNTNNASLLLTCFIFVEVRYLIQNVFNQHQLIVIHLNDTHIAKQRNNETEKPLIVICTLQAKQVKKSFGRIRTYNLEMCA